MPGEALDNYPSPLCARDRVEAGNLGVFVELHIVA